LSKKTDAGQTVAGVHCLGHVPIQLCVVADDLNLTKHARLLKKFHKFSTFQTVFRTQDNNQFQLVVMHHFVFYLIYIANVVNVVRD